MHGGKFTQIMVLPLPSFAASKPTERSIAVAIYHCSIKIIGRGSGKSAVAAAAYRAGEKIFNEYDGRLSDYTRKKGIAHTEIMLPDNAPAKFSDRAVLWNAVERVEKAKNSQLAREIEIALPKCCFCTVNNSSHIVEQDFMWNSTVKE